MSLYERLAKLKAGTEELGYGREILTAWAVQHVQSLGTQPQVPRLLDLGVGEGMDLLRIQSAAGNRPLELHGLDCHHGYVASANAQGITVKVHDIEHEPFPYADASFDIVLANQVLEHTKEIFFMLAESARILKPGGILMLGVPNLLALHNRILMLFGRQPNAIAVVGPHVRAFTRASLSEAVQVGGDFVVEKSAGAGFYPFPREQAILAARFMPDFAVGSFVMARRTAQPTRYAETFARIPMETRYALPNNQVTGTGLAD